MTTGKSEPTADTKADPKSDQSVKGKTSVELDDAGRQSMENAAKAAANAEVRRNLDEIEADAKKKG